MASLAFVWRIAFILLKTARSFSHRKASRSTNRSAEVIRRLRRFLECGGLTPLLINVAGRHTRRRHCRLEPFLRMGFGGKHKSGVEPPQSKSADYSWLALNFSKPNSHAGRMSGFKTSPICCMPSLSHTWGTTSTERQLVFPCDRIISNPDDSLFRGVTIDASPAIVYRWLCQMRAAPYSYDW